MTRPVFTGCLNCLWLPTCATSYQPSCFKSCMTSRLDIRYDTHFLHTCQVAVYKSATGAYVEDGKGIQDAIEFVEPSPAKAVTVRSDGAAF